MRHGATVALLASVSSGLRLERGLRVGEPASEYGRFSNAATRTTVTVRVTATVAQNVRRDSDHDATRARRAARPGGALVPAMQTCELSGT